MVGRTLGHCEAIEPLDGGGTGMVHRPHNTARARGLATKVQPEGLAGGNTWLARLSTRASHLDLSNQFMEQRHVVQI